MDELNDIVGKQTLILSVLSEKIFIVNYLFDQLTINKTHFLFRNDYSIFTAHMYLRSAMIDLGTLIIDRKKTDKNNFHRLY
jgi:hypothetical protein